MVLRLLAAVGLAGLILVATSPARADIYRCKRKDGTHHYTNIREPGRGCQLVVRGSKRSKANTRAKKARSSTSRTSGAPSKDPARYSRYSSLIDEA
ncbi:MAG: DUF4124 domain-containing protein, partial [Polyangiales bacterium]